MTGELIGNGNAKYTGRAGSLDTVGRVFQGDGFDEYIREMRGHFRQVATRKPKASRGRTNETFLLAKDLTRAE